MKEGKEQNKAIIKSYENNKMKIYAYTIPEYKIHEGHVKIGQTTREKAIERIYEQLGLNKNGSGATAVKPNLLWEGPARRVDNTWFTDKEFHRYLIEQGIENVVYDDTKGATEWFDFRGNPMQSQILYQSYIALTKSGFQPNDRQSYVLRPEQLTAVNKTLSYYYNKGRKGEYLWNAKPRFGKTLTAYDFMKEVKAKQVLIVTNRPSISNAWVDDFNKFIARRTPEYYFVSDSDALKDKGVYTRQEYVEYLIENNIQDPHMIAFVSLQDLKGSMYFGGEYEKLEWLVKDWDLLIIDEAHEGVDTDKMDIALDNLKADFILHLSGTPFKILEQGKFNEEQIYNWTYLDEQLIKTNWDKEVKENNEQYATNPYADLPEMQMFSYQIGEMVTEQLHQGVLDEDGDSYSYAFSLNEFFKTEDGKFTNEEDVNKFLDNLVKGDMPFSPTQYADELNHTFWLLNRVDSVKALEKVLRSHEVFSAYEVIIAAGDGKAYKRREELTEDEELDRQLLDEAEDIDRVGKSYDRVIKAIHEAEKVGGKTITLSVGQLTTGVTIPQWTGVLMLSDIKSPSLYFQAAFRSQNPHSYEDENGNLYRKERSYIFDFSPDRTLELYNEFANNLASGNNRLTDAEREDNIRELLNFFPIISQDEEGKMVELSASNVMTYPNRIKADHVVRQGFMSNLLFKNVHGIFNAPKEVRDVLNILPEEKNKRIEQPKDKIKETKPLVNEYGEVDIPQEMTVGITNDLFKDTPSLLGDKVYKTESNAKKQAKSIVDAVMAKETQDKYKEEFKLTNKDVEQDRSLFEQRIEDKITKAHDQQEREIDKRASEDLAIISQMENSELNKPNLTEEQRQTVQEEANILRTDVFDRLDREKENLAIQEKELNEIVKETQEELVEARIVKQEVDKQKQEESEVRDRLRGFTRTIPSALMAYGDRETTIDSYDREIPNDVFIELTSITKDQFKMLRDGWVLTDDEGHPLTKPDGTPKKSEGFFNKPVFNEAIRAFFQKKEELADYEMSDTDETIFDYIPLQKTNQQFTPVSMVRRMVDVLEKESPGIFSDPTKTFLDPYAKSGLFIEEIAKRLMVGLKDVIKDEDERLKHIYTNQLYAVAPTEITYQIVKNHINRPYWKNIKRCDLTESAVNEKMQEKINELFGGERR